MHLVEQRLNSFTYRFRRLSWREEAGIHVPPGEDPRDVILAHALHDISGLPVRTFDVARSVIRRIPRTLRWRIFVVYRGNLPPERYFSAETLYRAPDFATHTKRLLAEGDASEDAIDQELVGKFGAEETREAREMERTLAKQAMDARKAG